MQAEESVDDRATPGRPLAEALQHFRQCALVDSGRKVPIVIEWR